MEKELEQIYQIFTNILQRITSEEAYQKKRRKGNRRK